MKGAQPVSLRTWLVAALSLLLVASALALRWRQGRRHAPARLEAPELRAELAAKPAPDPAGLVRWRERNAALLAQLWTEPNRSELEQRLGHRWQWLPIESVPNTRSYVLRAVAPETVPWSALVAAVASLESSPGALVEGVTIATAGTRTMRQFSGVEIHVRFQWAEAGTGHTVPPESVRRDRVLPGPDLPGRGAGRRARAAPLRRTSASAQPPAPARPSLRSRPDHPRRFRSR